MCKSEIINQANFQSGLVFLKGPAWSVLFLVYIIDLLQHCDTSKVAIYADDTTLLNAGYNCERQLDDSKECLTT